MNDHFSKQDIASYILERKHVDMYEHFSKQEVVDYVLEKIYFNPIDVVNKLIGVYDLQYNRKNDESSFMFLDGISHYWKVKITPDLLEAKEG